MRAGNFAHAWELNRRDLEARVASGAPKHVGPRHLQHIWRGEPLAGQRVLVRCYHGLGDTIQFARFAAPLRRIAREVIFWVQPELMSLVSRVEGVDRALPLHDGTPEADYDVDIEVMELAFALRALPATAAAVPYLTVPCISPAPALDARLFHVGVAWRAGDWDPLRSVRLEQLAPLAALAGVRLHLLQDETERSSFIDAGNLAAPRIEDVAANLARLSLVLTIDTMMAHLAGALGVRTWTMLRHDCDWRWGTGDTSAWYPTMRLFRQPGPGQWQPVIDTITLQLADCPRANKGTPRRTGGS